MFAFFVVGPDPVVEIGLQLGDLTIHLLSERYSVELVQHQGNRVKELCGDEACEIVVVPCGSLEA